MYIYNNKHTKVINQKILNTDCCYYKNIFENKDLPSFFLNITIPQDSQSLLGLYIHFEIPHLQLNKEDIFYHKCMSYMIKQIEKYFYFENTNLIRLDNNEYFIVIFNVSNIDVVHCAQSFIRKIQKRTLEYKKQYYHFEIHCGIYSTQSTVNAYDFYHSTKEQCYQTIKHQTSISFYSI